MKLCDFGFKDNRMNGDFVELVWKLCSVLKNEVYSYNLSEVRKHTLLGMHVRLPAESY